MNGIRVPTEVAGRYWSRYTLMCGFSGVMISIKLIDVHMGHDSSVGVCFAKRLIFSSGVCRYA